MISQCRFDIELLNSPDFIIISRESGDFSLNKKAKIILMWNSTELNSDVSVFNAEVFVNTTNLGEEYSFKKNVPVFVYR